METDTQYLLSETIRQLFTQAARDGVITDQERNIITQVELDAKRYCQALNYASEDGFIDPEEKKFLNHLVRDIEDSAIDTMLEDGTINRNEQDLILKLQKILKRYYV